ncbi:MAG: hypothetical protein NTX40_09875 [Planctomycetota bacterium]|nr:hypothetical protein [Planctomycetota bacterium]
MRVLLVQSAADLDAQRNPYRHEVALLGAVLRARGHDASLLILESCDEAALDAALTGTAPDAVALYVESLSADLARRIADSLARITGAQLLLFGPHPARCPDDCLSMSGVQAVAISPADRAIPAYLDAPHEGLEHLKTPGLWIKCESGIMRNAPVRPPESLSDSPPPARDLYLSDLVLDSGGYAEVCVARGGETRQAAAPVPVPTPQPAAPWPVIHRPLRAILQEMFNLAEEHIDMAGFRITNPRWVSAPEWLAKFADAYARDVALPFRTVLAPRDVTDAVAPLLARAGCEEVLIEVGSGSTLIRNDILDLEVSAGDLAAAFAALRRAGVRSAARVEIGAPYETPASLDETLLMLNRLAPDRVEAVLHFPAPGTRAYAAARENGWLVGDPAAAYRAGRPALALPALSEDDLITARETVPYAVHRPRTAALIRLARRAKIGKGRTFFELVVKPFLGPPIRR